MVSPTGDKVTEFYDINTGFKIRTVQALPGGATTLVTDYSDYKEVNGVKFQHSITINGVAPFPIKNTVVSIDVNKGIDDGVFVVE